MPGNPFDQFDMPSGAPGPVVIGTPRPKQPPAQTPAQARKDELEAIKLQREIDAPGGAKLTEAQGKAASFYESAVQANNAFEKLSVATKPRSMIGQTIVNEFPMTGTAFSSSERQQADSYARSFVNNILRFESGAQITPAEFDSAYKTYFPQPGESPDAIEAKRILRQQKLESLKVPAGPGLQGFVPAQGTNIPDQTRPPGDHIGASSQLIVSPAGNGEGEGSLAIETGKQELYNNPAFAGAATELNNVFKGGGGMKDAVGVLQKYGIPPNPVQLQAFADIIKWRAQHPGYNGNYDTSAIEKQWRDLSPVRAAAGQLADTPYGAAAVGAANAMTGGYLDELAPGSTELNNAGKQIIMSRHPLASTLGTIGGGVAAGLGIGEGLAAAGVPAAATPVLSDLLYGATFGSGENNQNRVMGGAQGAALGFGGGVAGRAAGRTLGSLISPTGGKLAPLYAEGVQPSLGQRMGASESALARGANRAEQAFTSVPVLGGVQRSSRNLAVTQMQTGAFNQALREIGDQLPSGVKSGTAAHSYMQGAFDKAYDAARSGLQFAPDGQFGQDLGQVLNDVGLLGRDSQGTFKALATKVGTRLKARGGQLTGDDYKTLVSEIDRKARAIRRNPSGDGELADALENFSAALDNGARRSSHPDAVAKLDQADRGYAKAVIIEDAARRRGGGDPGEFTGNQLDAAVQNMTGGRRSRAYLAGKGLMQEYATAAKALGDTVPDSGTFERAATGTALVGAGGAAAKFISPITALPYVADTVANLPVVRSGVNAVLKPRGGPGSKAAAKWVRDRAYLGGLFGVPLAIEGGQ